MEVWEQVVLKFPGFVVGAGTFYSWLFVVMHNKFVDGQRRRARHPQENIDSHRGKNTEPCAWTLNPEVLLEREEERQLVARAMEELRGQSSAVDWQLLHMRWLEERTVAEITSMVAWPPPKVRNHLARAFPKLARILIRWRGDGL